MVANFSQVKRHDILLQALAKVRCSIPDVRCLLIGDGPTRPAIEHMAVRMGLTPNILFLGSRPDVPALLCALDVFVLTSDSESFSNAVVEAMAAGKPVVSTDCGGPSEIVVDGGTGFLVPTGQSDPLAAKISALLTDPDARTRFGLAGRTLAVSRFDAAHMVRSHETMFTGLLDTRIRPHGDGTFAL